MAVQVICCLYFVALKEAVVPSTKTTMLYTKIYGLNWLPIPLIVIVRGRTGDVCVAVELVSLGLPHISVVEDAVSHHGGQADRQTSHHEPGGLRPISVQTDALSLVVVVEKCPETWNMARPRVLNASNKDWKVGLNKINL